ncbi:MAG: virulence RhuM family protein [bacterium]|nr:virulence RhuM family protein [bacterium]
MKKIPKNSQIIIYKTEDGRTKIDVRFDGETVWLTQNALAELFQTTKQNISQHIINILEEAELKEDAVVKDFLTAAKDGKNYQTNYYNLDLIISVGYRVKSSIATSFRQWATQRLREYIVKGFILDDERLKNPDLPFDYFEELTRRIADIRTSEKRFYHKITDIYATSVDYDPTSEESILFFKTVQNKVHWAITGQTAPEIILSRADSAKSHMGLTSWRGAKPRKDDAAIAKNYLNEAELLALNNLVEQYLVFAEGQALRRVPMYMKNWIKKLNDFLTINDRAILNHPGSVSHEEALDKAEQEYAAFHKKRNAKFVESDFDREVKKLIAKKK